MVFFVFSLSRSVLKNKNQISPYFLNLIFPMFFILKKKKKKKPQRVLHIFIILLFLKTKNIFKTMTK